MNIGLKQKAINPTATRPRRSHVVAAYFDDRDQPKEPKEPKKQEWYQNIFQEQKKSSPWKEVQEAVASKLQEIKDYSPVIQMFKDEVVSARKDFYKYVVKVDELRDIIGEQKFNFTQQFIVNFEVYLNQVEESIPKRIKIEQDYALEQLYEDFVKIKQFYIGNLANLWAHAYMRELEIKSGKKIGVGMNEFFIALPRHEQNVVLQRKKDMLASLRKF
jgi:hypothetical protein